MSWIRTRLLRWLLYAPMVCLYPFISIYQPRWLITLLEWLWPDVLFHVQNQERLMSFTFDDGPNPPCTEEVLKVLSEHKAKATFFVVGEQVSKHGWLKARIVAEGHQVCNHFFTRTPTVLLGIKSFVDSLTRTEELIQQHTNPKYLRPASTLFRPRIFKTAKSLGHRVVLGSAYAADARFMPVWYVRWAMKRMLRPGVIAVLHDGIGKRRNTVSLVRDLLHEAERKGLKPVTLYELCRRK